MKAEILSYLFTSMDLDHNWYILSTQQIFLNKLKAITIGI
jgi:hypothetical protein